MSNNLISDWAKKLGAGQSSNIWLEIHMTGTTMGIEIMPDGSMGPSGKIDHDLLRALTQASGQREAVPEEVPAVTVEEIHKSFKGRAMENLKTLDQFLAEIGEIDTEKADRYRKLGFNANPTVVETAEAVAEKEAHEKKMQIIQRHAAEYPIYPFLFDEDLDALCKKYGLVHAPAKFFKEDIPEECLKEIEAFNLKDEDTIFENVNAFERDTSGSIMRNTVNPVHYFGGVHWTGMQDEDKETIRNGGEIMFPHQDYTGMVRKTGFNVVGKVEMFETPEGFEFSGSSLQPSPVPDPIVIQRVRDGFLIISAWGDEAEIPEVNVQKQ